MTRETKAGLVVSSSFLCLVAVVLYCKINGKNPALGEDYADIAFVSAPSDPTPIEEGASIENGPSTLAAASTNSGPTLDSTSLTAPSSADGLKPMTTGHAGYNIPAPLPYGNDDATLSASSSRNHSASDTENKKSEPLGTKTASGQDTAPYAIPDSSDTAKNSASNVAGTDGKNHSTKDNAGATLDPLADLKEAYKEAKNTSGSKGDVEISKTGEANSNGSGRKDAKNSETDPNGTKNSEVANSFGSDLPVNKSQTNDRDANSQAQRDSKNQLSKESGSTSTGDLEPPPIPAGLNNPYRSLPEGPTTAAGSSETINRTPRDAKERKSSVNPSGIAANTPSANGGIRAANGTNPGTTLNSSSQGTVPASMPNLTPTVGTIVTGTQTPSSSPSSPSSRIGGADRDGRMAATPGQGNGLTPGVMPSPRMMALPPSGDTAPEPNVRLGPPVGGTSSAQSVQGSPHDSASALPPSNQFAQVPAPNFNEQSSRPAIPYTNPAPATGPIQPAGFPAAKVDSYDEETYLCKAGDKFEDISRQFYQTEKYAQALLLFNRNHPRANSAVRQDPPSLGAGQSVFIPPLRVLEKQYATAIPDHAPSNQIGNPDARNAAGGSSVTGVASGTSAGVVNPAPLDNRPASPQGSGASLDGQTGGNNTTPGENRNVPGQYAMPQDVRNPVAPSPGAAPLPATRPTVQGQDRIYQVPKNGETFWEIARKTLGNPNRWSEIRRLNPQLDPKYPVPGGTNLKMPADARIDPVNPVLTERGN